MKDIPRKKKILLIVFIASLFVAMTCSLTSTENEVDINSGRSRERVFVYGIALYSQEYDAEFSKEVARLGLSSKPSEWCYISLYRPGVYGPIFDQMPEISGVSTMADGAMVDCEQMVLFFEIDNLNDQKRREIINKMMQALKQRHFSEIVNITREYTVARNEAGSGKR